MTSKYTFGELSGVKFRRSQQDLTHKINTAFNVGELVPLSWTEVLPGDTFDGRLDLVVRLQSSFLRPVMDDLTMEVFSFFVPYRILFPDFEKMFSEATPSSYLEKEDVILPTFSKDNGDASYPNTFVVPEDSIGDYLGVPIKTPIPINELVKLPYWAYATIYNEHFRVQSVVDEVYVPTSDDPSAIPNNEPFGPNNIYGKLAKVRKRFDYFTSCLPNQQRGQPVTLPVGSSVNPRVVYDGETVGLVSFDGNPNYSVGGMSFGDTVPGSGSVPDLTPVGFIANSNIPPVEFSYPELKLATPAYVDFNTGSLGIDLADLRYATQVQMILERDARSGGRFREYLLSAFGVVNADERVQIPEYLGGGVFPISLQQVAQTSQGSEESPLANVAAYSLSNGRVGFKKSFTEHGLIMTLGCVRQVRHSYAQGLSKKWTRKSRFEFYDPLLSNISEQPVYTRELYMSDISVAPGINDVAFDSIFGYNEAWADYRFQPSSVTSQFRPNHSASLDIWSFVDEYSSQPFLNKEFIEETPDNVDRTISVPSTSSNQFIVDGKMSLRAVRVMPLFSRPNNHSVVVG